MSGCKTVSRKAARPTNEAHPDKPIALENDERISGLPVMP
jgi:hypothetical protein